MSYRFGDVDPRRESAERQDFLSGSAPVEVAGLVEARGDAATWAGLLVIDEAAFRVWPKLRGLMALVSTGEGEARFLAELCWQEHDDAHPMPDVAAQMIRTEVEDLWAGAEVIAYTGDHLPAEDDAHQDRPASGVSSDEGVFRNDGCPVQHRSQQAAENCLKRSNRTKR